MNNEALILKFAWICDFCFSAVEVSHLKMISIELIVISLSSPSIFILKNLCWVTITYTVHIKSCISCKSTTKEVSNYTWHKQILLSLRRFLSCYKHERYFWDLVKNYFTAALILANPILYKIYILTFAHGWFGKCLGPVTWSTLTFWERWLITKLNLLAFFLCRWELFCVLKRWWEGNEGIATNWQLKA